MWKKDEVQKPEAPSRPEPSKVQARRESASPSDDRATIGRSITIRGEVIGDEDLVIQGRVEGSVNLKQHAVTIGPEGEVTADVSGRIVTVEGHVEGNLRADEQVILRGTARVHGDITSPRVMLEDGAYFRGGVDMGDTGGRNRDGEAGRGSAATTPASRDASRDASSSRAGAPAGLAGKGSAGGDITSTDKGAGAGPTTA
jgi:cytoskeletal protein CcmA (bactofilin family)